MSRADYPMPYAVQFRGNAVACWLLRRLGWTVRFEGLPALQGVLAVYPHTSNWDFVLLVLVKWAAGIPVRFWSKDSLFRIPVFRHWLRALGGVPVRRTSAQGVVAETVAQLQAARAQGHYFWLALAPEGTRKWLPGWRSGFYRTALAASVPLGLVRLDYRAREVCLQTFLRLSGNVIEDFARIAAALQGARGYRPQQAAPIQLLDASVPRSETIVK